MAGQFKTVKRTKRIVMLILKMVFSLVLGLSWDGQEHPPPGGGSHMKQTGILVVSLRGVNFRFWSRLGCSGHDINILTRQETQNYAKRNRSQMFFLTCFVFVFVRFQAVSFRGQNLLKPRPDWSPLGVTKSLSHAQMVSFSE